jgi:hypothetical protein
MLAPPSSQKSRKRVVSTAGLSRAASKDRVSGVAAVMVVLREYRPSGARLL